jgi:hypothetical protein
LLCVCGVAITIGVETKVCPEMNELKEIDCHVSSILVMSHGLIVYGVGLSPNTVTLVVSGSESVIPSSSYTLTV